MKAPLHPGFMKNLNNFSVTAVQKNLLHLHLRDLKHSDYVKN